MTYAHDWNDPSRPRWGSNRDRTVPPGQMRVSDLERQAVTDALCRHFGDGRLDEAEFNARMERATSAKTRDDLAPLLMDLPPYGPPIAAVPTGPHPHRRHHGVPVVLLVVLAVLILSSVPFTFFAWHGPWVLVVAVVVYLAVRRRGRSGSDHTFHA